jgi:cytosine/adenosine deaminase-related metal-dependent hydrolase
MRAPHKLLITNARIVPMTDGSEEISANILVSGDEIAGIGTDVWDADAEVIDARQGILLPGFVDTHRHTWQSQLRSTAGDWTLFDYVVRMRMTYSRFYEPEDVYLGNMLGAAEALNSGITTLVDHCHIINSPDHTDEAIRGLADSGIRGLFCYGIYANPISHAPFAVEADGAWRIEDFRRIAARGFGSSGGRIILGMAPSEPSQSPIDNMAWELRVARENGAQAISLHVGLGPYHRGGEIVCELAEAGALCPELLFVHGASLTDRELALIANAGAGLSSTPETELQMGMGFPVAARARAAGVRASLGVDIVSNCSGDMFTQMRLMLQAARAQSNDAFERQGLAPRNVAIPARDVLRLATLGGAEALGLEKRLGTIEVGKQADLILVRTDGVGIAPATNAVNAVLFHGSPELVDLVLVAGRIVKRDGKLRSVNWPAMSDAFCRSATRIVAEAANVNTKEMEAIVASLFTNTAAGLRSVQKSN